MPETPGGRYYAAPRTKSKPRPRPTPTPAPTEHYIPTAAEVEHYETVIKPQIEAAKKEEEEKVVKAPAEEIVAPVVIGAPEPIGLGIVAPSVAPSPAPTPIVIGAPEPTMGVTPTPKVIIGAPGPGIVGPPHVAPTPPPKYAPIPETAAYVPPPSFAEVPLSEEEVQVKYDTLHTQADELAAEREEMLGPGGFGAGWTERLSKLSTEEKRDYAAKVKEEEYLRQQAKILNDLILATKRKLPKGAKPYIEDILRDTGLPVTHTGEGTFYDLEKILASERLTKQFLEEFPEQKEEVAAYQTQMGAREKIAPYLLPGDKIDITAALSGGVSIGALGALGITPAAIAEAQAWLVTAKRRETTLGMLEPYFKPPIVFPGSLGFGLKGSDVGGYYLPSALAFGGVTAASLVGIFPKETVEAAKLEAARLRGEPTGLMAAPEVAPVIEAPSFLEGLTRGYATTFEELFAAAPFGREKPRTWEELPRWQQITYGVAAPTVAAGTALVAALAVASHPYLIIPTIKAGGLIGAVTGVGALATGIGTPPPEIKVGLYETVDLGKLGTAAAHAKVASYAGDYGRMVEDLGPEKAAATLAQAGYSPEIPLEAYERLSPEMQAVYTPSERRALAYEPGIAGIYARGTEALYQPPVEWLREKGLAGQIGAGMFQYMVPHTLVTELYPTKGALAALTLIPHFGPTAGYTGLTWEQQPWYGKAAGIGFAALPFAVGPLGSVAGWVGRGVSKVPVLGPTLLAPFRFARWGGEVTGISPVLTTLERVAPWQAAYKVGRAIPGYGPWAASKGWLGATTPLSQTWRQWGGRPVSGFGETRVPWEIRQRATRAAQVAKMEAELAEPGITSLRAEVLRRALTPPAEFGYGPGGGSYVSMEPGISVGHISVLPRLPASLSEAFKVTIPTIARQVMPRIATAGAIAAPMLGGAFLPMMAPTMFATPTVDISVLAKTDIATINQMLRDNVISKVQHDQIVSQIHTTQEIAVTPTQYHQEVQTVIQEQLTQQQLQQQQEIQVQQQQLLTEEQQATLQQVQQELVQQQTILQQMEQQEVPMQQQMEQQQVVQEVQQQVEQQQVVVQEQIQQEIVQQQIVLQEMEQQEVSVVAIQQQQMVIQELQQQIIQQPSMFQQMFQPFPGPVPPQPPIVPPIWPMLPLFPGFPGLGAGFARGLRAGRTRYGQVMWPFPEIAISMPAPWTGLRKKKVLRKKGKLPYGGRVPKVRMGRAKGIRI